MCLCVCLFVCICVWTCGYLCVYVWVGVGVRVGCVCVYVSVYVWVCIYLSVCMCMCVCLSVCLLSIYNVRLCLYICDNRLYIIYCNTQHYNSGHRLYLPILLTAYSMITVHAVICKNPIQQLYTCQSSPSVCAFFLCV